MTDALVAVFGSIVAALIGAVGFFMRKWFDALTDDLHTLGGGLHDVTSTLQSFDTRLRLVEQQVKLNTEFFTILRGDLDDHRTEFRDHRRMMGTGT